MIGTDPISWLTITALLVLAAPLSKSASMPDPRAATAGREGPPPSLAGRAHPAGASTGPASTHDRPSEERVL